MRHLVSLLLCLFVGQIYSQANFTEVSTNSALFNLNEARGVAVADYDNDGDDDILVAAFPSRLLRNEGDFIFTDQTSNAGLTGFDSKSAIWFDANNDGWLDCFLTSNSKTQLYLNDGDGTFILTTSFSAAVRQSINVGDVNGDQWPDIYSANFQQKRSEERRVGKD